MAEHTFDEDLFSDLHKDAHGFRPRGWHRFYQPTTTDDEKQAIWDATLRDLDDAMNREREQQAAAVVYFENKVNDLIRIGARDRATAVRWLTEAQDEPADFPPHWHRECVEIYWNLPYGYLTNHSA